MKGKKFLAVIMLVLASVLGLAAFVACGGGDESVEYTVTFDANGGVLDGNATVKVKKGSKITGAPAATKEDHTFEAWYDAAEDGTRIVLESYSVTKDVTLYAHYTPVASENVEITLNANGGKFADNSESKVVTAIKGGSVLDAEDPERSDYRFDGWYTQANGGELVDIMFDKLHEDMTLYAHWVRQYIVTFDANGGVLDGAASLKLDEDSKIAGAPTASKAGSDFYGWIEGSATGDVIDLETYVVKADVTLYAKYGDYTMPIKTLKNQGGSAIGYTIEAEDSKFTVAVPDYLSQWIKTPVENVPIASGGKSLGYMTEAGKTVTFSFKAVEAGTAKLYLRVTSGVTSDGQQNSPVSDKEFGSDYLGVVLNGGAEISYNGVAPGSGEPSVYNAAFASVLVGEVNLVEGKNTVVLTVKQPAVNLDCLDIETQVELTAVNGDAASGESTMPAPPAPAVEYNKAIGGKLIVTDHAEGPAISKAVLSFDEDITKDAIAVKGSIKVGSIGNVNTDKVYLSDADGVALGEDKTASQYVTIEYKYETANGYAANNVKPFVWNSDTNKNSWIPVSTYALTIKGLEIGDATYTKYTGTFTAEYDTTDVLAGWDMSGTYTQGDINLTYGWYTPTADAAKTDNKPLIIWLHGAGEGGTDPSIAVLGNQVTNLSKPMIQDYFTTTSCAGAYVLAPQSPTMWMDKDGNGTQGGSNVGESYYTEALFALIQNFVSAHSDIDTSRIYIGGCSNGAWMTVEMLSKHGEYFAAAYPVAVPYVKDAGMTPEEFEKLASVPMWITHAQADKTVMIGEWEMMDYFGQSYPVRFLNNSEENANSLYIELLKAGATNVHYSLFEKVSIAAGEDKADAYDGHYSWIYVLRDECVNVQATTGTGADNAFVLADINVASTEKVTVGGEEVSLWGWIAAQTKAAD